MKYMLMLFGSQQDYDLLAGKPSGQQPGKPAMSAEDVAAMHSYMEAFHKEIAETGELVDAQGLTAPVHARRVHLRNGVPVVTDGPYAESQEVLAGYTIVECESFDRATELAARLVAPDWEGDHVDIRPIADSVDELNL